MRIEYKDPNKNLPHINISYIEFEDFINVEIWDVNTNYSSLQMYEDKKQESIRIVNEEIKSLKQQLTGKKETDKRDKELIKEYQEYIEGLNKYKNKRYKYSKEEFFKTFNVWKRKEGSYCGAKRKTTAYTEKSKEGLLITLRGLIKNPTLQIEEYCEELSPLGYKAVYSVLEYEHGEWYEYFGEII